MAHGDRSAEPMDPYLGLQGRRRTDAHPRRVSETRRVAAEASGRSVDSAPEKHHRDACEFLAGSLTLQASSPLSVSRISPYPCWCWRRETARLKVTYEGRAFISEKARGCRRIWRGVNGVGAATLFEAR